jgi:2-polyprenyl-3-methyl-5-hydroxy-6-metoxy-1,4-benzoquinol methylase
MACSSVQIDNFRPLTKELRADYISNLVAELLKGRYCWKVLDVGCGSACRLEIPSTAYIVGVDISQEELRKNSRATTKILGDIQTCLLPQDEFDLVVSWDLLEHLTDPERALENMASALKPQGVIVLAFPNVLSIKGLITKITPLGFHGAFYKYIMRSSFSPFPTYLRFSMRPGRIAKKSHELGLQIEHFCIFEGGVQKRFRTKYPMAGAFILLVDWLVKRISLDRLNQSLLTSCVLIARKVNFR